MNDLIWSIILGAVTIIIFIGFTIWDDWMDFKPGGRIDQQYGKQE